MLTLNKNLAFSRENQSPNSANWIDRGQIRCREIHNRPCTQGSGNNVLNQYIRYTNGKGNLSGLYYESEDDKKWNNKLKTYYSNMYEVISGEKTPVERGAPVNQGKSSNPVKSDVSHEKKQMLASVANKIAGAEEKHNIKPRHILEASKDVIDNQGNIRNYLKKTQVKGGKTPLDYLNETFTQDEKILLSKMPDDVCS